MTTVAEEGACEASSDSGTRHGKASSGSKIHPHGHSQKGKTVDVCVKRWETVSRRKEHFHAELLVCPPCFEMSDGLFAGSCVFGFYPMILLKKLGVWCVCVWVSVCAGVSQ